MDFEYYPKGYDNFKIFLYKKVERISLALYLCTNHLTDNISLKTNIRQSADNLIKDILYFNKGQANLQSTSGIKETFLEIRSLINISMNCNLINQNNAQILLDEISKISKEIENQKDNFVGDSEFKKSFFVVESRHRISESSQNLPVEYKGHKGQENLEINLESHKENIDNTKKDKGHSEVKQSNSRTEEILKIIKDNQKVTIKDITTRISGCSEKTIQRELLRMVSLKMIKKEGERRWSTYSII